jgi:hypothetical protein
MNTVINQHLFRHRETSSAALNRLCTVIHKLAEEGVFEGRVVQGKRLLGIFRLAYDRQQEPQQVNIDLSAFDALFRANAPKLPDTDKFTVGGAGYIVFHASGHHDDLYVTLTRVQEKKAAPVFDSRKLGKGDIVAFRPWHPGTYAIKNELGSQTASLTVMNAENVKYRDPTKLEPVRVTLSDKGFDREPIEQGPLQALVVSIETRAALTLKSVKAGKVGSKPSKVTRSRGGTTKPG